MNHTFRDDNTLKACASIEARVGDFDKILRQIDFLQTGTAVEDMGAIEAMNAVMEGNLFQLGAVIE